MRDISSFSEIYFYQAPVDMRKQINGLTIVIEQEMKLSPLTGALFIFLNQGGTIIKFIYWDKTGFAVWGKRLEKDRYSRPSVRHGILHFTSAHLQDLLRGLDIFKGGHKELHYKKIC